MALPKGMKLSKSEVSQTFDTKKIFDGKISRKEKKIFSDKLIEIMSERTSIDNEDYRGKEFSQYTKKYAKFKKVPRDAVDMVLKNKMMKGIKSKNLLFSTKDGDVKVQVDKKDSKKAFGHMTAFRGHKYINKNPKLPKVKQRRFFGFLAKDVAKIADQVKAENPDLFNQGQDFEQEFKDFEERAKDAGFNLDDILGSATLSDKEKIDLIAGEFSDIFEDI